jgi:hypothetical protein
LSIVQYFLKHNLSETGSIFVFRCGAGGFYSVGAFSNGPKPEDGNRSSFRNVVFKKKYCTMDKDQKLNNPNNLENPGKNIDPRKDNTDWFETILNVFTVIFFINYLASSQQ